MLMVILKVSKNRLLQVCEVALISCSRCNITLTSKLCKCISITICITKFGWDNHPSILDTSTPLRILITGKVSIIS